MIDIDTLNSLYTCVKLAEGTFEDRFNKSYHQLGLTSDNYRKLKRQVAELSILDGFSFTPGDELVEFVSANLAIDFSDYDSTSPMRAVHVLSNLCVDTSEIFEFLEKNFVSKAIPTDLDASSFISDFGYKYGIEDEDIELFKTDNLSSALGLMWKDGRFEEKNTIPWSKLKDMDICGKAVDKLALYEFNQLKFNYDSKYYTFDANETAFLSYLSNSSDELPYFELLRNKKARKNSKKYAYLYKAWEHKVSNGIDNIADAEILDSVIYEDYPLLDDEKRDSIIKHSVFDKNFNVFEQLSLFSKMIFAKNPLFLNKLEPYIDIKELELPNLNLILEANRNYYMSDHPEKTSYSESFIKKAIYSAIDKFYNFNTFLLNMPTWLPECDSLSLDTPITLECMAYVYLNASKMEESSYLLLKNVLPINNKQEFMTLCEQLIPGITNINKLESIYSTSELIKVAVSSAKLGTINELMLPTVGFN